MQTMSMETGRQWAIKKNQLIEICANVKTKRCPEYDTFEGNSETMSVAIHTCDYTPPNEYPSCDRVSMLTRAKEMKFFLH